MTLQNMEQKKMKDKKPEDLFSAFEEGDKWDEIIKMIYEDRNKPERASGIK
jgi:hypothetical protein